MDLIIHFNRDRDIHSSYFTTGHDLSACLLVGCSTHPTLSLVWIDTQSCDVHAGRYTERIRHQPSQYPGYWRGLFIGLLPCIGALNWLNIPFAMVGILISIIALATGRPQESKGGAIAGLICSSLAVVVGIIRLILGGGVV